MSPLRATGTEFRVCGARRKRPRGSGWGTRARGTACSRWTTTGGGPGGSGRRSPGDPPSARTSWPGGCAWRRRPSGMWPRCRPRCARRSRRTRGASTRRWRTAPCRLPGRYPVEPWEPWHSVAAFKVRHVLMGQWQHKLANAVLLARAGPEAFGRLETRPPAGSPLAVPPDARLSKLVDDALTDVTAHLGFLAEAEPGSNAWAVSGRRTAHGGAVLCNDSHRALDTPNVYWQCRVSCPDFDVTGATFPGLPGFPHFGFNGSVAWAITHGDADTQDLYLERFEGSRYLTPDGWAEAGRQDRGDQGPRRRHRLGGRLGDPARAGRARRSGARHGPGAEVHGDIPAGPGLGVPAADADGTRRAVDGGRAGGLGRPGEQPGLRRRRRADRVSVPGGTAGAFGAWAPQAAGAGVGRVVRVDGDRAVRGAAAGRRSRGGVRDDGEQHDHGRR